MSNDEFSNMNKDMKNFRRKHMMLLEEYQQKKVQCSFDKISTKTPCFCTKDRRKEERWIYDILFGCNTDHERLR